MTWLMWLLQACCTHEDVRAVDGSRLFVRCLRCGRETAGILTGKAGKAKPVLPDTCWVCGQRGHEEAYCPMLPQAPRVGRAA